MRSIFLKPSDVLEGVVELVLVGAVRTALENAPPYSEPYTDAQRAADAEVREAVKRGEVVSHDEVRRSWLGGGPGVTLITYLLTFRSKTRSTAASISDHSCEPSTCMYSRRRSCCSAHAFHCREL